MKTESKRLLSLDVLRGFDMLFIMGLSTLIYHICTLFPNGAESLIAKNMEHAAWHGLTFEDTIFPLFLFIAGISFPFSYSKQVSQGKSRSQIYRKILIRGLVLVLLGLVYNNALQLDFAGGIRCASVLARIGLAWMFAALIYINAKTTVRIGIASFILIGYWLVLWLVPAPDAPAGVDPFSIEGNLAGSVDRILLPGKLYEGTYDPEGLLSTIPAIVTAMLGMFTGEFVRRQDISGSGKASYMFAAAASLLTVGLLWSLVFPINKQLWTSSFVLVVGAYSLAMFALFYWVIDVKGLQKGALFFQVVGLNSITIYMAQRFIDFDHISRFFLGGVAGLCPPNLGNAIISAGYLAAAWLFLYFLYKKQVFLKI